jgi:hypothetical protein
VDPTPFKRGRIVVASEKPNVRGICLPVRASARIRTHTTYAHTHICTRPRMRTHVCAFLHPLGVSPLPASLCLTRLEPSLVVWLTGYTGSSTSRRGRKQYRCRCQLRGGLWCGGGRGGASNPHAGHRSPGTGAQGHAAVRKAGGRRGAPTPSGGEDLGATELGCHLTGVHGGGGVGWWWCGVVVVCGGREVVMVVCWVGAAMCGLLMGCEAMGFRGDCLVWRVLQVLHLYIQWLLLPCCRAVSGAAGLYA